SRAAPAASSASPPAASPPAAAPAENAATYYRQAFALLPQKPDDPDIKAMKEAGDGPPTPAEVALVRKYDPAAQLLRRGAAVPRCDWGLDRTKGPDLLITHLQPTRTMAYLIALRFRHGMQEKRP